MLIVLYEYNKSDVTFHTIIRSYASPVFSSHHKEQQQIIYNDLFEHTLASILYKQSLNMIQQNVYTPDLSRTNLLYYMNTWRERERRGHEQESKEQNDQKRSKVGAQSRVEESKATGPWLLENIPLECRNARRDWPASCWTPQPSLCEIWPPSSLPLRTSVTPHEYQFPPDPSSSTDANIEITTYPLLLSKLIGNLSGSPGVLMLLSCLILGFLVISKLYTLFRRRCDLLLLLFLCYPKLAVRNDAVGTSYNSRLCV